MRLQFYVHLRSLFHAGTADVYEFELTGTFTHGAADSYSSYKHKGIPIMSSSYKHLLSPGEIGGMTLRNRVVLAAMGSNFANVDGTCSERLIAYYEERARGGAGLLVLETSAACFPNGSTMPNTVGFSRDEFLPGLTDLAARVHQHGSRIVAQLNHGGKMAQEDTVAGRKIPMPSILRPSASDMFHVLTRSEIGHFIKAAGPDGKGPQYFAMEEADIAEIIAGFADAAQARPARRL